MPDEAGGANLKDIIRPIILAQGNQFIKELLRKHKLKIGANKSEFEENLAEAIDQGKLTWPMVEEWLLEVEGWGDQHVYLVEKPTTDPAVLRANIEASPHAKLLDVQVSYDFPAKLALTAVRLDDETLSVDWHLGTRGWERAKSKDYQAPQDGDHYEFRAYRDRADRAVVRFEWCSDKPYGGLFVQLPNEGDSHASALKQVEADLKALGIIAAPLGRVPLNKAVKTASNDDGVVAHSTKMSTEGGHIDFVVTATDAGIGDVEAIRKARQGVQDSDFGSADGMLSFGTDKHDLSRNVKATVYGSEGRFRVWVRCKRDDIYTLADLIWEKNA